MNHFTRIFKIISFFVICVPMLSFGQWYGEIGLNSSDFEEYRNTITNSTIDTDFSKSYEMSLELGHRFNLIKNRLQLGLGAGYEEYQINAKDQNLELAYNYNLSYFKLGSELHLKFFSFNKKKNERSFWVHGGINCKIPAYGAQRIFSTNTNLYIDLMDFESFSNNILHYNYGANFRIKINDFTDIYFKYNLNRSFDITETNEDVQTEEFTISSKSLSFGVLLKLGERRKHLKKMQKQIEKINTLDSLELVVSKLPAYEDEIVAMRNEIAALKQDVELLPKKEDIAIKTAQKSILLFDIDSYVLTNSAHIKLEEIVNQLSQNPSAQLLISGYADDKIGKPDYNLALSLKRAEAVAVFLRLRGINESAIRREGMGGTSDFSDESISLNRRVEVLIRK